MKYQPYRLSASHNSRNLSKEVLLPSWHPKENLYTFDNALSHQADNEASCYQPFLSRKGHANIFFECNKHIILVFAYKYNVFFQYSQKCEQLLYGIFKSYSIFSLIQKRLPTFLRIPLAKHFIACHCKKQIGKAVHELHDPW